MAKGYRRKRYFVKKGFQGRFVLRFLGVSALGSGLAVVVFTFLAAGATDKTMFSMTIPATNTGDLILREAVYADLLALSFTALALALLALGLGRRLTGSLYRIRADLQKTARGDLKVKIAMRRRSEFQDFAGDLNAMTSALNRRFVAIDGRVLALEEAVRQMKRSGESEPVARQIEALDGLVKAFKK